MEPYLSHAEPCYHEEGQNIIELGCKQDDVELMKMLDARGFYDHQLWDFVASHGAEKILEFLLTHPEIKVNEIGHKMPILATACQDGQYNIVKRLSQIPDFDVDVRIDLYVEGFEGMTALYFTYDDNIEIFNLLMDLGASLTVKSEDGRSPLFSAADVCQLVIVRAMINHGAEVAAKDLNKVLSNWTRPDEREEIVKTLEAVLEVLRPGQAEVRAAAEVSPQVSPHCHQHRHCRNFILFIDISSCLRLSPEPPAILSASSRWPGTQ